MKQLTVDDGRFRPRPLPSGLRVQWYGPWLYWYKIPRWLRISLLSALVLFGLFQTLLQH